MSEKQKNKNTYTEDSIISLEPREFTRLKPGVYCGSTIFSTQLLVEVLSNSIDEYRLGHGDIISITTKENGEVTVSDHGQGFLVNKVRPEDGKTILEAAFSVLNTSGKYKEDGTYEGTSLGSFGIGGKLPIFLSTESRVRTTQKGVGKYEEITFKDGILVDRKIGDCPLQESGTTVFWKPDKQFFTNVTVEDSKVRDLIRTLVALNPGLTIDWNDEKFISKNGLKDLVAEHVGDKEIIDNRFEMHYAKDKEKLDMILTYTTNYSSTIVPYVNTGLTEKGPHITQIKTLITREFNKFFRDKKWLKEKDENLSGDDIQEGMFLIFNMTAPNIAYDSQVKTTITKIEMKNFTQVISDEIQKWLTRNEKEIKIIAEKTILAKKAREAAKKARDGAREKQKRDKVLKFDKKLADCYGKDRTKCELYICEGDSAAGNLKVARNTETQAILAIRGKILNIWKAPIDKMQKNAEVMSIIDALGLELDFQRMKLTYDKSKLRYGKIIIMSDADSDGNHIKNLFFTLVWTLCPELVLNGHIFEGYPPLYRVSIGKDKYIYLKDDEALKEYKTKHKTIGNIVRMKGLGEMDVDETEQTLISPESRNIAQMSVDNLEIATELFDILMGTRASERKEFIEKNATKANVEV